MTPSDQLRAVFNVILAELDKNPTLADAVAVALAGTQQPRRELATRSGRGRGSVRRSPATLDPYSTFEAGEAELRVRLESLTVEQLKDIVSQFSMDSSRLALKWKTADRLIDLIVARVKARVSKGDAFRQ